MFDIIARTNLGPLEKYPQQLMDAISKVVRATAFRIERDAKLNCPVDTGALRASIYTVTDRASGYAGAIGKASSLSPNASAQTLPTIAEGSGPLRAFVAVGMKYGAYVEYGSANGKRAPKPFMVPAAEANRQYFHDEMAKALKSAAQDSGGKA